MDSEAHIKTDYDPLAWQMLVGDFLLLVASLWRFFAYHQSKPIFLVSTFILLDGAFFIVFGGSFLHSIFRKISPTYKSETPLGFADMHYLNSGYLIGGFGLVIASIFFCFKNYFVGQVVFLIGTLFLADTSLYGFNRKSCFFIIINSVKNFGKQHFVDKPPYAALILFFIGSLLLFVANIIRITDCSSNLMPYVFLLGSYALFEGSFVALFARTTFGLRF